MRRDDVSRRHGAVLLEAIVALLVLATAGIAVTSLAAASADAVRHARAADREMARASAFLDAVALWPREDLDRHLGDRLEGAWRLRVDRPSPTLYVITLVDTTESGDGAAELHGGRVLLATALYRPEAARAAP